MIKICPHCGSNVFGSLDAFCPNCRRELTVEQQETIAATPAERQPWNGQVVEFTYDFSRSLERRETRRYIKRCGAFYMAIYPLALVSVLALFVGFTEWYVVLIEVALVTLAALIAISLFQEMSRIECRTERKIVVRADGNRVSFQRAWCTTEFSWEALREVWRYRDAWHLLFGLAKDETGIMLWPVPTVAMAKGFISLVNEKAREFEAQSFDAE